MSDPFSGASILVTGGAGFVGSNLVGRLLREGAARLTVVDNLLSAERWNLADDPRLDFREGSIADPGVLSGLADDFDFVFHLATFHGNQNSIADPLADHANNTLTTLRLFDHLRAFRRLRTVVYASAGCAVAEKTWGEARPTTEDDPVSLWMDSPYSISKIVGEFYGNWYFRQHGLPVVRARFQNVYGPGEILGAGAWRGTQATVWRNVTPTFVYRALKGMPLKLENGGIAGRDFIFVSDIVAGLLACAQRGRPGEAYNLASGVETSIRTLAESVVRLAESRSSLEIAPARDWDRSGHRYGSTEKAGRELGFAVQVGLEEGLVRTIDWTKANLDRIEACIGRHAARMAEAGRA